MGTGNVTVARANAHITYPAQFQLVAAMNPCRCGYLADANRACRKAPLCGEDYQARVSGPIYDRMDLIIEVPSITARDLACPHLKNALATLGCVSKPPISGSGKPWHLKWAIKRGNA